MVLAAMKWKYWQYLLILLGVGFYFADESMWRYFIHNDKRNTLFLRVARRVQTGLEVAQRRI
jgi:hypothetical protein